MMGGGRWVGEESGGGRMSDLAWQNLEHTFDYVNHAGL